MNKSFTLIEILVVIVVIGILSAFILVGMSSISDKANIAKSQAFANSLRNSLLLNLVSEWKLDGNANDSWGTNTGAMYNFPASPWKSSSECIKSQCLEFDGSDDFISIPNSTTVSDTFNGSSWLVSAWFKPNIGGSGGNGSEILQRYSSKGFLLRVTGTTSPYFIIYISDGVTPHSIGGGYLNIYKWNYIVAQRDNSSISIYIDGIFKNSLAVPSSYDISSSNPIYIGEACCSSYNLNGVLDEISVYNSPKQSFEIQQDYYLGVNRLFKNNDITLNEFNFRLAELKSNLANNE